MLRPSLCALTALAVLIPVTAWSAEKVPSDLAAKRSGKVRQATPSPLNMIYTPIAPCRAVNSPNFVDTGETIDVQITGSGNFGPQGGPANGCGVPASAKAVAINISAVNPTNTGHLKAFATGTTPPETVVLGYRASINQTSGATIGLNSAGQMSILARAATKVAVDVTGYYEPQLWAYVNPQGELIDSSGRVTGVTRNGIGDYTVTFDRAIDSCAASATADLVPKVTAAYTTGNSATVHITALLNLLPQDYFFNLMVKC